MTTKKTFAQLLVLPAVLVSLSASATELDQPGDGPFFGEDANGQWLIGGKLASMNNSDDGISQDSAQNAGIILGYEFARPVWKGKAAFEFQYLPSVSWGDVNGADSSNPSIYPNGGRWENPVYSGYVAYRTPGKIYAKGKVGIVASRFKIETTWGPQQEVPIYEEVPVLDPETGDPTGETETVQTGTDLVGGTPGTERIVQENKTQIGYGLGVGVHIGKNFDLELEYEGNQGKSQLYDFGINAIVKLP
ncbi:MAG: outer membrane beta-barrel protein [Arenicellales bacterium]